MATRGRKPKNSGTTATLESIAKMQLDAQENFIKIVEGIKSVSDEFNKIKDEAELAKEQLGYDLKAKEVEINDSIFELEQKLENEKINIAEQIEIEKEKLISIKETQSKEIEDITYTHSLALRDKNLDTAVEIAKNYEMTVVDSGEYNTLQNRKEADEASVAKAVDAAEKAASSKAYAIKNSEISTLKNEKELEVKLLQKELELTLQSLENARETISEQKELIKAHPAEIQKALSSAKINFNQNFDGKK